jgi:hypothetical protein
MGKLLDATYWSKALDRLAEQKPKLGESISKGAAQTIRKIGCETLSGVLSDPDFSRDLDFAIKLAKTATIIDTPAVKGFEDFLSAFMLIENKIFQDAGVNTVASRDLQDEIKRTAIVPDPGRLDAVKDKIGFLHKLACNPEAVDNPKKPLWRAVWRGTLGLGLVAVDGTSAFASAVTIGPVGVIASWTAAAISSGYGFNLFSDGVRDYF